MNKYKLLIERNNLKVNKVTIKGKVTIIDTPLGKFVLRDNKGIKIYDYLLSRGFNYFPEIIDYDNEGILCEYIDNIEYDKSLKADDFVKLLSLLHAKTSYFVDNDENYEKVFEELDTKIDNLTIYYTNMIDFVESKEYMSPSEYLISRNISIIFSALNYSKNKLKEWYDNEKKITKKRVVTLYNNVNLNNLLKSTDKTCLISFEKSITGSPIYDLISLYNKYYLAIDFYSLLNRYENNFPLLQEEMDLLLVYLSIPEKIIISDNILNFKDINYKIKKIYRTLEILNFKEKEAAKAHEKEDNKK